MGNVKVKFLDYSDERSDFGIYTPDLTAANFDATIALIDALVVEIEAVSLGTKIKDTRSATVATFPATLPVSPSAQRESKWLIKAVDNVLGGDVRATIPTADLQFLVAGTGAMNLAAGQGLSLKNALEAVMLSKYGNAVTVNSIEHVGRTI